MRLVLSFPPPWRMAVAPDDRVAAILPGDPIPDAIVTYGPLIYRPEEPARWHEHVANSDAPDGARVVLGRAIDLKTADGWPVRLLEAELRSSDDQLVEVRLCAFYTFMEHAAAVIARTMTVAKMEQVGASILGVLRSGRPDWRGDEVAALVHAWDVPTGRRTRQLPPELRVDVASLVEKTTHEPHDENAWYALGLAHAASNNLHAAIDAWSRAATLGPNKADTWFNLGQARWFVKDYEAALASWEKAYEIDPLDVMVLRKLAQCLHALERHDEAFATRALLREAWTKSDDPRVRMISEYVFDQFEVEGHVVLATETLRPPNPEMFTVIAFRTDPRLPNVVVETSDRAKAAGTPFVLGVTVGGKFRGVATWTQMLPYGELKRRVIELMKAPPTPPA